MKVFPIFCFFVVYLMPYNILGITAMFYDNGDIDEDIWKAISVPCTILFSIFSPLYVMSWAVNVLPTNGKA